MKDEKMLGSMLPYWLPLSLESIPGAELFLEPEWKPINSKKKLTPSIKKYIEKGSTFYRLTPKVTLIMTPINELIDYGPAVRLMNMINENNKEETKIKKK